MQADNRDPEQVSNGIKEFKETFEEILKLASFEAVPQSLLDAAKSSVSAVGLRVRVTMFYSSAIIEASKRPSGPAVRVCLTVVIILRAGLSMCFCPASNLRAADLLAGQTATSRRG